MEKILRRNIWMREMFENFDIFDIRGILLIVEKKREKSKSNLTQVFLVKKIVKYAIIHKIVTSESGLAHQERIARNIKFLDA